MNRLYKSIGGSVMAALLILSVTGTASAQRGRGGFRGGIHLGIGGPRGGIGFGFGFRPHYFYPRVGFFINTLPYGYYPFLWGPDQYYYYGGVFYRPYNNGYAVVAPPVGAAVPQLPPNTQPISIDGQQYYENNGVYYKDGVDDKGNKVYIIAGKDGVLNTGNGTDTPPMPKVGDVVSQLPDNCQAIKLGAKKYYVSPDGTYYEAFTDKDHQQRYRVAGFADADADPQAAPSPQAAPNNNFLQQ